MFVDGVAKEYGIVANEFEKWLLQSEFKDKVKDTIAGIYIRDTDVEKIIDVFRQYKSDLAIEEARKEQQAEKVAGEKRAALASILITSGFSFDGYTITKYSGYISGDDAVQVARSDGFFQTTDVGPALMASLVTIRRNALNELKEAAYALGCNAVIGVDFDYITLDPETANYAGGTLYLPYVFGVTANGNAVIIEKNKV